MASQFGAATIEQMHASIACLTGIPASQHAGICLVFGARGGAKLSGVVVDDGDEPSTDAQAEQQTATERAKLFGKKLADFVIIKKVGGKDVDRPILGPSQSVSHNGVCSYVYLAQLRGVGAMQYAIKVMLNYEQQQNSVAIHREFEAETELLADPERLPPHPHVMVVLHSFTDTASGLPSWDFEADIVNPRTLFVVMPYVPNDLKRVLRVTRRDRQEFGKARAVRLVHDLLKAVRHLKSHGIVHRDVKLDNVLLAHVGTEQEMAVLTDFGKCLDLTKNGIADFRVPLPIENTRGGAPIALAPEVTLPRPGPGVFLDYRKNDEWAVGMIAHELLSTQGDTPFPDMEHPETYADDRYQDQSIAADCRPLVSGLLKLTVADRLDAADPNSFCCPITPQLMDELQQRRRTQLKEALQAEAVARRQQQSQQVREAANFFSAVSKPVLEVLAKAGFLSRRLAVNLWLLVAVLTWIEFYVLLVCTDDLHAATISTSFEENGCGWWTAVPAFLCFLIQLRVIASAVSDAKRAIWQDQDCDGRGCECPNHCCVVPLLFALAVLPFMFLSLLLLPGLVHLSSSPTLAWVAVFGWLSLAPFGTAILCAICYCTTCECGSVLSDDAGREAGRP